MPFLCVPGWDIYVFSHESSETIKNIWFQSVCSVGWLFWAKKTLFLFLILIGPNHSEMVPNGKKLSDTTFGPFGTISEWFGPIWTKNGKNGVFTKSGQPTEQKSYFDWFRPFLSTPANPVQFFWLKMACTYVPDIDLYVSCWTCTSRGSLRPPKRPSKARNGQKDRFFWSRPKIVGQRGKNWPSRISPMIGELITLKDPPSEVSRFGARRPSPVKKITSWPISKFKGIYMQKKSFWPKQKGSNSSQIIQWSSVGHITIHFRGLRGLRRAPKPKFWLFDPKIQNGRFRPFSFSKVQKPYQWS